MKAKSNTVQGSRISSIIIKSVILLFIIFSLVSITSSQISLSKRRGQLAEYEKQKQELQLSNDELKKLLDDGSYNDLIERSLRENGYVTPDETVYTDIAGN